MALNVSALRSSFEAVRPQAETLADVFYETLFSRYLGVKPLFANVDIKQQKGKLIASIALVVASLEKPDVLTRALKEMGARHVGYGAEEVHYPAVGECLLHALATVAGPVWTNDLAQAWTEAYGAIAGLMIEGAREHSAAA